MKSFKSILSKAAFIALFLFVSGNFLYGQVQPVLTTVTDEEAKIKFAGFEEDMLVFEVQLSNLSARGTNLNILDENNNNIFMERILRTSHNCRYKIARNNMELITFKISGKTISFSQSFTINFRVEEKVEVKKL